jgi:hypothetical protein
MRSFDHYKNRDGLNSPSPALRRWGSFFSGLLIIVIFVSVIAPWILNLPYMKAVDAVIQERGIEANLYDYTEVEMFAEADFYMRHALDGLQKESSYIMSIIIGAVLFGVIAWIGYRFVLPDRY